MKFLPKPKEVKLLTGNMHSAMTAELYWMADCWEMGIRMRKCCRRESKRKPECSTISDTAFREKRDRRDCTGTG